jgi:hypothetical protein
VRHACFDKYADHQEKATSVMNWEKLKNMLLFQTSQHKGYIDKGGRMANSYSIREHGSGQKNYSSISWN